MSRHLARIALVAALAGCNAAPPTPASQADVPTPAPQADKPAAPVVAAAPGVRADGEVVSAVPWFEGSFDEALAAARTEDKLVFVDVGAYWCPPCRELDEKVFVLPEVGAAITKRFVALHIDAEKGEGPEFVERYKVQAYPTLLVLEASGVEKGRLVDSLAPEALLKSLDVLATGGSVLAELEQKVAAAPDDLQARYDLAVAYALAARREEAEAELAKVIAGDPDNARGLAARAMFDRAAFLVAKQDRDSERAIAEFKALQQKFPQAKESLRAHRSIGRELHKLGRDDEAVASLEAMVASDPNNPDLKASFGWFSFRERCRPEAGLKAVDAGIAQAPKNPELHYLRAELLDQLGRGPEALAAIQEAARLEPESAFYKRQVRRFTRPTGGV